MYYNSRIVSHRTVDSSYYDTVRRKENVNIARLLIYQDYQYIQTIDVSRLSMYPDYRCIQYVYNRLSPLQYY